ncbi:MAG: hypothetical protein KDI13_06770 [Alphaproteobacteria bacterium]|nr:hypothetical protein [Alphaproteobacteria bacterium]
MLGQKFMAALLTSAAVTGASAAGGPGIHDWQDETMRIGVGRSGESAAIFQGNYALSNNGGQAEMKPFQRTSRGFLTYKDDKQRLFGAAEELCATFKEKGVVSSEDGKIMGLPVNALSGPPNEAQIEKLCELDYHPAP